MQSGNDSSKLNKARSAKKKMFLLLKQNGYRITKHKHAIRAFAAIIGAEIHGSTTDWLVSLWDSGAHDFVKKTECGFYHSKEWLTLRKKVLKNFGSVCMKCGSTDAIHVDHIKPRSLYRELELEESNLQVLCAHCNCSKSNRNEIDYR